MSGLTVHNIFKIFYYEAATNPFDVSNIETNTVVFKEFPTDPEHNSTGFYNIAVDDSLITFHLIDNIGASTTEFEDGDKDTYYFEFPPGSSEDKFVLIRNDNIVPVIEYKTKQNMSDINATWSFAMAGPPTTNFENGALMVSFQNGTNITELGQKVVIAYGSAVDDSLMTVYNTFQPDANTGEHVWDRDYDFYYSAAKTGSELPSFPALPPDNGIPREGGFYDITIDESTITFDLKTNEGASHLVYPPDSFDRYYIVFPKGKYTAIVQDFADYNVNVEWLNNDATVEWGTLLNAAITPPTSFPKGALKIEFGPGTNMTTIGQKIVIKYHQDDGNLMTVYNTFQPNGNSGELLWDMDQDVFITGTMMGSEFPSFPAQPPRDDGTPREGGFYDITIDESTITFDLKRNEGASHLVYPLDSFDRYYIVFPKGKYTATIQDNNDYNVNVEWLKNDATIQWGAMPNTFIAPTSLPKGALKIEFGPGTNMTALGQKVVLKYTEDNGNLMTVYNTFQPNGDSGELLWDMDHDVYVTGAAIGSEFPSFPAQPPRDDGTPREGGFYDITIDESTITFVLKRNAGASHLVYPPDSFDRYYIVFPMGSYSATVNDPANYNVNVEWLKNDATVQWRAMPNTFVAPTSFPKGALKVEFGPGTNMTDLQQKIVLDYTMGTDGCESVAGASQLFVSKGLWLVMAIGSYHLLA